MFGLPFVYFTIAMIATIVSAEECRIERRAGTAPEICEIVPRNPYDDPVLNQRHLNQFHGMGLTEAQIRERAAIEYRIRVQNGDPTVVAPGTYADEAVQ